MVGKVSEPEILRLERPMAQTTVQSARGPNNLKRTSGKRQPEAPKGRLRRGLGRREDITEISSKPVQMASGPPVVSDLLQFAPPLVRGGLLRSLLCTQS